MSIILEDLLNNIKPGQIVFKTEIPAKAMTFLYAVENQPHLKVLICVNPLGMSSTRDLYITILHELLHMHPKYIGRSSAQNMDIQVELEIDREAERIYESDIFVQLKLISLLSFAIANEIRESIGAAH